MPSSSRCTSRGSLDVQAQRRLQRPQLCPGAVISSSTACDIPTDLPWHCAQRDCTSPLAMAPRPEKLPVRPLGSQGMMTGAQGLGCMGFSFAYQTSAVADSDALAVIDRAQELGQTMLDSSDLYGPLTNEKLIAQAIKGEARSKYAVATKFGFDLNAIMQGQIVISGKPDFVRKACEASLERLAVESIDLYYQHRVDPNTPITVTVAAMAELVREGKVRYLGISEVSAADLRAAHAVHPISAVQLEWSLFTRDAEAEVIPTCRELGIGIVAYSPLGRGFLTGEVKSRDDLKEGDVRRDMPRFSEENFGKNMELVAKVREVAARRDCTPGQVALAWLHAQGPDVFPIPGTKRIKYLEENVAAFQVQLTEQDLADLDALSAIAAGGRHHPADTYKFNDAHG